ncbi:hypothetical protein MHU86_10217 [Fragilaria crotonensis]|nr:hypothetical protein MHU86_10217 [Fragilaria crotonensis]
MAQQQHEQSQIQMLANFVMSATSKDYNSRTASSNLFNVTTGLSLNLQQQNGGADAATINDTPKEMFMKPNNPSQQLEKLLQGEYLYKENSKQETNKLSKTQGHFLGQRKGRDSIVSKHATVCFHIDEAKFSPRTYLLETSSYSRTTTKIILPKWHDQCR